MSRRSSAQAPHRIPPLPPVRGQRELATGWWGEEWIDTLETPDPCDYGSGHISRLSRARTYARKGAVGEITVRAGSLTARVQGSRRTPYRCEIHVPELDDELWEDLVAAWTDAGPEVMEELAEGLADEAAARTTLDAQIPLVPLPGELAYHCSCPDWGDPCKHAAALGYQFARALDARPDALLVLRGRVPTELYAQVAVRSARRLLATGTVSSSAGSGVETAEAPAGVPAGQVFARARQLDAPPALPALPAPPDGEQQNPPPDLASARGLCASVNPDGLQLLAVDAARRAAAAYACAVPPAQADTGTLPTAVPAQPAPRTGRDPGELLHLDGDSWADTVRWAAGADDDPQLVGRLLSSSDRARARLARSAVAWRHGGADALAALDGERVPDREAETAARAQLLRVTVPGRSGPSKPRRVRGRLQLVGEDVELRWGPDGRWYPYRKERGEWWPAGPPATDAGRALLGAFDAG